MTHPVQPVSGPEPKGPARNRLDYHQARVARHLEGSRGWRLAVADWLRGELEAGADPSVVLAFLRDLNRQASDRNEGNPS